MPWLQLRSQQTSFPMCEGALQVLARAQLSRRGVEASWTFRHYGPSSIRRLVLSIESWSDWAEDSGEGI